MEWLKIGNLLEHRLGSKYILVQLRYNSSKDLVYQIYNKDKLHKLREYLKLLNRIVRLCLWLLLGSLDKLPDIIKEFFSLGIKQTVSETGYTLLAYRKLFKEYLIIWQQFQPWFMIMNHFLKSDRLSRIVRIL